MPVCGECELNVTRSSADSLTCVKCNGLVHNACANVNITKKDFERLKKGVDDFICSTCKNKSDISRLNNELHTQSQSVSTQSSSINEPSDVYLNAIRVAVEQGQQGQRNMLQEFQKHFTEMFNTFKNEQLEFNKGLSTTISLMKDQINENSNKISNMEIDSTDIANSLKHAKTESAQLKIQVSNLENIINIHEQSLLSSSLEVHGFPEKQNENLSESFVKIANSLQVTVDNENIVNIYRIRRQNDNNAQQLPPTIFVKLTSQNLRDKIIKQRKNFNNFSTVNMGWTEKEKSFIYIRESLTPLNRRIYSAALSIRKQNKIKYLWIANGKMFGRKTDGERRFQLTSLDAVNAIK